jgi:hypothetical protein
MKKISLLLCLTVVTLIPRPGLSADARRPVQAAYRAALNQPAVRSASEAEIRRQLSKTRPIALVKGYWVTPIDLSLVYAVPTVRTALGSLAPVGAARFGIAFTPNQLAGQLRIPISNISRMIGVEAIQGTAAGSYLNPEHSGVDVFSVISYIEAGWDWLMAFFQNWEHDSDVKGNEKNCGDKGPDGDCDGDGTKNKDDGCPNDPDPKCGGGSGSMVGCMIITCQRRVFTTEFGGQIDSVIQQVATDIRQSTRANQVVPLGVGNLRSSIRIAFPPVIH